jgi:hypothetical protein
MKDRLRRIRPGLVVVIILAVAAALVPGCKTIQEVTNLRDVNFSIDRVAQPRLAGIDVSNVRSYRDVGASDMLRLSAAIADGELPLSFTLHLDAENPPSNSVKARLTQMDWTLMLNDRETVSGTFDREVELPPGEVVDVPVNVNLDLMRFFGDNLRDLVDLALAVGGEGEPQNVKLKARPTIRTPLGPMKYPNDITIVNKEVGQQKAAAQ